MKADERVLKGDHFDRNLISPSRVAACRNQGESGRMCAGYCGPKRDGVKEQYEVFSNRNGTLCDDSDGAPRVGASATRKYYDSSGDANPPTDDASPSKEHPQQG